MQALATTLAFLPLALVIFASAVAAARSKILPGWYAGISGLAALLIVVGVGTVAQSGAFSPNGGYSSSRCLPSPSGYWSQASC
jgi:hypothetical protein